MIEPAYSALAAAIAADLVAAQFLPAATDLMIDPEAPFSPSGDERVLVRAAALVKVRTGVVRTLLGGAGPRYVIERECRLELALAGPARLLRDDVADATLGLLALLSARLPTLGGAAERLTLGEQTDDELPPNGISLFLTFTIRVRSGDPLGRTA
jgi:hypothetical protein